MHNIEEYGIVGALNYKILAPITSTNIKSMSKKSSI